MIALAAGFFPAQHMLITSMQLTWYLRSEPWSFLCSRLLIKSFLERFLRFQDLQFSDWGVGYRIFHLGFVRAGAKLFLEKLSKQGGTRCVCSLKIGKEAAPSEQPECQFPEFAVRLRMSIP
jgi:hypothetical protein